MKKLKEEMMTYKTKNGQRWFDTEGDSIQAHGGGIMYHEGYYYWYGENKDAQTNIVPFVPSWLDPENGVKKYRFNIDAVGVSCYRSRNLTEWENCGVVLPSEKEDYTHDLYMKNVLERPKVIYNEATNKFVMWLHVDTSDYQYAKAGVAVSDSPTGPFSYISSFRPNGAMSRDITLFKDDDGQAYIFFSSENNGTLHICRLSEDYLEPTEEVTRNFINAHREAPAVFKRGGSYYIVSSGCTGWDPNVAEYAVAKTIMGPYETVGNPCVGHGADITFRGQSTYVFRLEDGSNRFVFMADIWKKENLSDSRYIWLPIEFEGEQMKISWQDDFILN